jgi:hypothetical protein
MGIISKILINLGETHWKVFKRIFKYLKCTSMSKLLYDGKRSANLMGFADVDWDFDSRRST